MKWPQIFIVNFYRYKRTWFCFYRMSHSSQNISHNTLNISSSTANLMRPNTIDLGTSPLQCEENEKGNRVLDWLEFIVLFHSVPIRGRYLNCQVQLHNDNLYVHFLFTRDCRVRYCGVIHLAKYYYTVYIAINLFVSTRLCYFA